MKRLLCAFMALSALTMPASANASVTIGFAGTDPIPSNNNFQTELNGLGLTQLATTGATLVLNGPSTISFEFLGSESGFNDTFSTSYFSYTEFTSFVNNFALPVALGGGSFTAGSLAGLLNFTSVGGTPATVGQDGFGIFLGPNAISGQSYSTFYLGYDDQINNQDDNHDDFIVRAVVTPAVPEPATWAMMLLGFGIIGGAMRHSRRNMVRVA